ncbi:MAG: L-histidine N(alpha)-methyltransferase, partial [Halobacteriales archaeon]|nr:L-histidine N(alpha)-methyltransferase [Halobacteriales archaeon]
MSRALLAEFAEAVTQGLAERPKRIPPEWLLDAEGARLLERAAQQPECHVLRAEREVLREHARAMVPEAKEAVTLVALGADEAPRLRLLIDAMLQRQGRVVLHPLDLRGDALRALAQELQGVPGLRVRPVQGHARASLRALPREGPRLVLLLGPRLGQLGPVEGARFLGEVRGALAPGDGVLTTAPAMTSEERLVRARDDAAGAMAAFHRNLLARMDRELGAVFEPERFGYEATWDAEGQ